MCDLHALFGEHNLHHTIKTFQIGNELFNFQVPKGPMDLLITAQGQNTFDVARFQPEVAKLWVGDVTELELLSHVALNALDGLLHRSGETIPCQFQRGSCALVELWWIGRFGLMCDAFASVQQEVCNVSVVAETVGG